jgi:hypothetical protein
MLALAPLEKTFARRSRTQVRHNFGASAHQTATLVPTVKLRIIAVFFAFFTIHARPPSHD